MSDETWILVFTGLTAFATFCAASAAIIGPYVAARIAVSLQRDKESRDKKFYAFSILMAHRMNYGQKEPSQALNLIDVLWRDNKKVRDAWSDFYRTLPDDSGYTYVQKNEKLRRLLEEMAADLDLAGSFTPDDFARAYLSKTQGAQEDAMYLMNMEAIGHIQQRASANTVNQSTSSVAGG